MKALVLTILASVLQFVEREQKRRCQIQNAMMLARRLVVLLFMPLMAYAAPGSLTNQLDLFDSGQLLHGGAGAAFPTGTQDIPSFINTLEKTQRVKLTGGSYWLYGEFRVDSDQTEWVFDPNNGIIEHIEARLYGMDGSIQTVRAGYAYPRQYMLHYGQNIALKRGVSYQVLIHFNSPYFASQPRFEIVPRNEYTKTVLTDNLLAIGAFGALLALAVFNFFIFLLAREKSHLYYSIYLMIFFVGWLLPFQVPTELWGFQDLRWHYVAFFLCPIASALFCIEFLQLKKEAPRFAKAVWYPAIVAAILGISGFVALPYAHLINSAVIALWMPIALAAGIYRWRQGFRPARFFVFAFSTLMMGGAVILPPNLGLTGDIVRNAELVVLLSGTVEAMLLAFALADRIGIITDERQRYVQELRETVQIAHTDALTGIGNRYALDQFLQRSFQFGPETVGSEQQLLALLDVDGLKQINDKFGHVKGDDLLRTVANGLRNVLGPSTKVFRLGGDEFALIAPADQENAIHVGIAQVEKSMQERELPEAGISYGIAYSTESASPSQLLGFADRRMYRNKRARKRGEALSPNTGFGVQTQ